MDDDGKSNITEEIVFLWDGYSYILKTYFPDSIAEQEKEAELLFR